MTPSWFKSRILFNKTQNLTAPAPPQTLCVHHRWQTLVEITVLSFAFCNSYYRNNKYIIFYFPNRRWHCKSEQALQTVIALSPKILMWEPQRKGAPLFPLPGRENPSPPQTAMDSPWRGAS